MLATATHNALDTLITRMAESLIRSGTDLHDERQVLRALVAAGFGMGDIVMLSDQVLATARAKTPQEPK